jgi:hypothetical protein
MGFEISRHCVWRRSRRDECASLASPRVEIVDAIGFGALTLLYVGSIRFQGQSYRARLYYAYIMYVALSYV